jgi:hypothetical protein
MIAKRATAQPKEKIARNRPLGSFNYSRKVSMIARVES